ncbi:hypothetical protein K491DRAFT_695857 [Lophiostoma macrostomum CBS 122681]|uniref:Uncharacterized protein n=1 Tax=Lophiostoma macrostomum CBS 122681 TaxID=1314788 RepID=A0A6A6SZS8_9PLEO|nr:hypothetical protein K491DRAFT_695857 [Lophiostoma macrostomum CBS 122681]
MPTQRPVSNHHNIRNAPLRKSLNLEATMSLPNATDATDLFGIANTTDVTDPYGTAKVSGFYGPGTWSSWYLALVASAMRIYTKPHARLDPNTWLFVVGTNWAAMDLLRILAQTVWKDDGKMDAQDIGRVSAAIMLAFWGNVYALAQVLVLAVATRDPEPRQRLLTHLAGFVLPTVALNCFVFSLEWVEKEPRLGGHALDAFPILYFGGEELRWVFLVGLIAFVFVMAVGLFAMLLNLVYVGFVYPELREWKRVANVRPLYYGFVIAFFLVVCFSLMFMFGRVAKHFSRLFILIFSPVFLIATFVYSVAFLVAVLIVMPLWYFVRLVLTGFKAWSNAAYFMPLAPQLLTEWDQAFGLFLGVSLLFGFEVYPAVVRYKNDRRMFEVNINRRMANARGRRGLIDESSSGDQDVDPDDLGEDEEPNDLFRFARMVRFRTSH